MAINYTTLPTQLGGVMGLIRAANTANDTIADTDVAATLAKFSGSPAYAAALASSQASMLYSLSSPVFIASQAVGITTLIETVDTTLAPLTPKTELVALKALIADMVTQSKTIQASAAAAGTPTAGSGNTGTGEVKASVTLTASINRQNCYAETLKLTCLTDRASGLNYSGNEIWSFAGKASVPLWSADWPAGSGVVGSFNTCSAAIGGGQVGPNKSLVIGGDFNTFVSTVPTYWEAVAGASLMVASTDSLRGTYCVQFTGDGATQVTLRQKFGQSSSGVGTNPTMPQPLTHYRAGVFLKRSGAVTGGVMRLSLKNNAGTVLASVSVNVTSLTTSYVYYSVEYITLAAVPTEMSVVLESTTAIPAGEIVRADELTVVQMVEAYPSGPLFSVVAGGTDFAVDDTYTIAITNDRAGIFQQEFARMFPAVMANRLVITSGGSPNISDSLVAV